LKCYIYCWKDTDEPIKPLFYAGLGSPFKLSPDFQFAQPVDFDTTTSNILQNQLEKTYRKDFYFVQIEDVVSKPDHRCFKCGLGWTDIELLAIKEGDLEAGVIDFARADGWYEDWLMYGSIFNVHLGSTLRKDEGSVKTFITKITNARRCKNEECMTLYCADCAPPKRGSNSTKCDNCRPAKRWER
jgi:hypothetical protein